MASSLSLPAPWVVVVLLAVSAATLTSGQCIEGTFGPDCRHLCHCVNNSICDVSSGECDEGCQEGYSGPWCQRRNVALGTLAQIYVFGTLYDESTQVVDGNNRTCDYLRTYDNGFLNVKLNSTQDISNVVVNIRKFWFYRPDIMFNLSSGNITCASHQVTNGQLLLRTGCDMKTENLMLHFSFVDRVYICEVEVFICEAGFHGDVCDQLCGHCRNADCSQKTGSCAQGCEAGYTGSFCNQTCAEGTYGVSCAGACGHCYGVNSCNLENGTCAQGCEAGFTGSECKDVCVPGRYGHACRQLCGHCGNGSTCDPVLGSCPAGCDAGYSGEGCQDECTPGMYGLKCASTCGHCYRNVTCDFVTGSCPGQCEAGYAGEGCHEKCSRETFGVKCEQTCPPCDLAMTCHHVTGACPQITDRQDTGLGVGMGAGVGVGVAVCLVLVGVVLGVLYLLWKRGCVQKKLSTESPPADSRSLTPIIPQTRTMVTRNEESENAYSGLELSTRNVDNLYQEMGASYENMAFSETGVKNM